MTMVNCLTLGRAGYMMCDTAEFGVPSLVVRGFGDKIATLEQQRMLIATRGEASLGPRMTSSPMRSPSFAISTGIDGLSWTSGFAFRMVMARRSS
jgi:hypothetical protein